MLSNTTPTLTFPSNVDPFVNLSSMENPQLTRLENKLERIANNLTRQTRQSVGYERLAETLALGLERIINPIPLTTTTPSPISQPSPVTQPSSSPAPFGPTLCRRLRSSLSGRGQGRRALGPTAGAARRTPPVLGPVGR